MPRPEQIITAIRSQRFLPLFFHADAGASLTITQVLYNSGVRVIEYTNRGETALRNFSVLKEAAQKTMPDLLLGIGTVKSVDEAKDFIDAKADFIIAPIVNPEVAQLVQAAGLLWVPGAMTPTEVYNAQANGASFVKVFPGNVVGPDFISAIRGLFPKMLFMPTGGVDLNKENISRWLNAGCCAVGLGSKLIDEQVTVENNHNLLKTRLATAFQIFTELS